MKPSKVNSMVELIKYSLTIPGVKYVLSEHLTQDCLEAFIGQQRMKGGRNDNPTVKSFLDNTASLRLQGSQSLKPFMGNTMR
uniref:Transposable element P transposase-like RNase H C-terminal domain-containing protein n=1 Tax=Amphimedon queenslandica TaxID=400682 RepID=A0A1X7TEI6_AMPQE